MEDPATRGQIVILNGAPRSGKSSIALAIQRTSNGIWMNLGNDTFIRHVTPQRYQPGVGLRPGGERPDLEPLLPTLFAAMYESIAAHSRLGLNVVADVDHHDSYSRPLHILPDCARRLRGLPVLFVGVRCPIEVIMTRRRALESSGVSASMNAPDEEPVPLPVRLWQTEVHIPGTYDLEVDTSQRSPEDCADFILRRVHDGPPGSAFHQLAEGS